MIGPADAPEHVSGALVIPAPPDGDALYPFAVVVDRLPAAARRGGRWHFLRVDARGPCDCALYRGAGDRIIEARTVVVAEDACGRAVRS